MDKLAEDNGIAQHAVAYALGSTVMYGTSRSEEIFGLEHADAEDYQLAMRVGKKPLLAQVGIEVPIRQAHWIPSPAGMYIPLEHGVRASRAIPEHEVPGFVPLVQIA